MTDEDWKTLAKDFAGALQAMATKTMPKCARCGHDWAEHKGCCTHYGIPEPGRVDPICFCRGYVDPTHTVLAGPV